MAPQTAVRGPPGRELAPDAAGGRTVGARGATDSAGGRGQLQSNRSDGGGRGAGTSLGSPRWVRIFRMTTGSSMVATTRMRPPQRGQANTSTAKVWQIGDEGLFPRRLTERPHPGRSHVAAFGPLSALCTRNPPRSVPRDGGARVNGWRRRTATSARAT